MKRTYTVVGNPQGTLVGVGQKRELERWEYEVMLEKGYVLRPER